MTANERGMLKDQWVNETAAQSNMDNQRVALNRQRNQDLILHNEAEQRLRLQALDMDKNRDRDMLATALEREEAVKRIEEAEKLARREEVMTLQKFYQQGKGDKAAYEKMIETLVAAENGKQWDAREAQWRRED